MLKFTSLVREAQESLLKELDIAQYLHFKRVLKDIPEIELTKQFSNLTCISRLAEFQEHFTSVFLSELPDSFLRLKQWCPRDRDAALESSIRTAILRTLKDFPKSSRLLSFSDIDAVSFEKFLTLVSGGKHIGNKGLVPDVCISFADDRLEDKTFLIPISVKDAKKSSYKGAWSKNASVSFPVLKLGSFNRSNTFCPSSEKLFRDRIQSTQTLRLITWFLKSIYVSSNLNTNDFQSELKFYNEIDSQFKQRGFYNSASSDTIWQFRFLLEDILLQKTLSSEDLQEYTNQILMDYAKYVFETRTDLPIIMQIRSLNGDEGQLMVGSDVFPLIEDVEVVGNQKKKNIDPNHLRLVSAFDFLSSGVLPMYKFVDSDRKSVVRFTDDSIRIDSPAISRIVKNISLDVYPINVFSTEHLMEMLLSN